METFWRWRSFPRYLNTLATMSVILFFTTMYGAGNAYYNVILGTLSSGIEVSTKNTCFYTNSFINFRIFVAGFARRSSIQAKLLAWSYNRPSHVFDWYVAIW